MAAPFIQGALNGGELNPDLWGQVDLVRYHSGLATGRNGFVNYRGGFFSRGGTAFVGRCKQTPPAAPPRDIKFQFSLSQGYALEFGDNYMRIKIAGAYVLEPTIAVTGASQADPCQITAPGHAYANGDWVFFASIGGMVNLNGNTYIVANSVPGTTFTLTDLDGIPLDATGFPAYTAGGTVARLYTLATPYAAVDLPYLKSVQSADVVSLTCVNLQTQTEYPPYDLSRFGATNWTIAQATFSAPIAAPTGLTISASDNPNPASSPPTRPCAYAAVVTAVEAKTGGESVASAIANVTNSVDMGVTAGSLTYTWNPVPGAAFYNVYRSAPAYNTQPSSTSNALPVPAGSPFFFAGLAYGTQLVDTNITTDANKTPPLHQNPFARGQVASIIPTASSGDWDTATVSIATSTGSGYVGQVVIVTRIIVAVITINPGQGYLPGDTPVFTGNGTSVSATLNVGPQSGTYPAVVSYFQQRRFYAQSLNNPDTFWASQAGLFLDYDVGNPPIDTDAITGTPFSLDVNGIQWLIPMPGGLVVLTGTGAWQLTGTGGSALNPQPITPSSIQAEPQAFNGVSPLVEPVRINYDILYAQWNGAAVYDLAYNIYFNIYNTEDISWPSAHMFAGHQITQRAWCREPYKLIWYLRDDGVLLCLAWVKEQQVSAWTRHDTQGLIVSVCSVTEPPVDALYVIVKRYVQGRWLYFSERMDNRIWQSIEDSWCVDCAISTLGASSYPAVTLTASSATGVVNFTASSNIFAAGNVGNVIRMGGGIATITGYSSPTVVAGQWTRPLTQTIPDDTNNVPLPAAAGQWSLLAQVSSVGGLQHLAGKSVIGMADGIPIGPLTVSGQGTVALPFVASRVVLGLQFVPQAQSLYLDAGQPTQQGRRKNIVNVTTRVAASGYPYVLTNQPDGSAQDPPQVAPAWAQGQKQQPAPQGAVNQLPYKTASGQTVTPLATGDIYSNVQSTWRKPGQIALQQTQALPMNIVAIIPDYLEGDTPEQALSPRQQRAPQPQRAAA